ncbi:MAG: hypothetical protein O9296_14500 [Novosphingobium sp.]|jgi:hypothetical protein|nr:hypothetical protein [Novosphingobium sp.]
MTDKSSPSTPPNKPPVRQRTRAVQPAPAEHTPIERTSTAKSQSPAGDNYKVGYRNPPKHSQFQPGFDARRPNGRKAGAKNKANAIVAMMESPTRFCQSKRT